ncbi:MAG: YggS family pyridoxal phosphate-dependent enzyme [Sphingomonadaceae bacterium]
MSSLRERLESVYHRVALAAERAGRLPSEVRVVAVSKTVKPETIAEAYRLGQRDFGENRVQELREKRRLLDGVEGMDEVRWHMIGHLQSNKAKLAVQLSDIIQSVDSVRLAGLLDADAKAAGRRVPVLLQVDFTSLPQRAGFAPDELRTVVGELASLHHLRVQGLMTIAPLGLDRAGLRAVFRGLRLLRNELAECYPDVEWRELSMGMSDDFETAIEEGSTIVRIGRAIFGERPHL